MNIIGYNTTILAPCVAFRLTQIKQVWDQASVGRFGFGQSVQGVGSERVCGMATVVAQTFTTWTDAWVGWAKRLIANPQLLTLLLTLDVAAYFAGLIFWYGYVMTDPATPMWVWPFVPDCPFFGLLGGLGLLMVIAQRHWSAAAQVQGQRMLWGAGLISLVVWLSTYVPGVSDGWREQGAMFALWTLSLLVAAIWFRQPPAWLLGIFAFGQIKYGLWTITAWLLYWRSTAQILGAPDFNFDGISMTVAHIGLAAQGVLLLTYFRPNWVATLAALLWFGASDFADYGLGFYPAIPEELISLEVVQWSTITVTVLLVGLYCLYSLSLVPSRGRSIGLSASGDANTMVAKQS